MNPFLFALLCLNVAAAGWFAVRHEWSWVVIYIGAGLIQAWCLWESR